MTLTLENQSKTRESSLTKALRQVQQTELQDSGIRAASSRLCAFATEFD